MPEKNTITLRVSRHFAADAAQVFDAWLDPKTAGKWLFATPKGSMMRVKINARPGGVFNFTERRDGKDIEHTGQYIEIVRPERLVFTFRVPLYSFESTRVTIHIAGSGATCDLALTHDGVWEDFEAQTLRGWNLVLDGLTKQLEASKDA